MAARERSVNSCGASRCSRGAPSTTFSLVSPSTRRGRPWRTAKRRGPPPPRSFGRVQRPRALRPVQPL